MSLKLHEKSLFDPISESRSQILILPLEDLPVSSERVNGVKRARNNNNVLMTFIKARNWFFITRNKFYFCSHNRYISSELTFILQIWSTVWRYDKAFILMRKQHLANIYKKKSGINKTQAFDEDKRNHGTLKSSFFHSRSFYACYEIKHVFA